MNSGNPREGIDELKRNLETFEFRMMSELESLRRKIRVLEEAESGAEEFFQTPSPPPLPEKNIPARSFPLPVVYQAMEQPKPVVAAATAEADPPSIPPVIPRETTEVQFGKVWLVRIGVAALLTGLVLGGNHAYKNWIRDLPNGVRLTMLFVLALGMIETGRRLTKREWLSNYGEVVFAGGLAFFYFCTFAAHGVERLRVIENPVTGALLLALAAAGIGAVSWLRQSKATALLAVVFATYAVMIQPMGMLSCISGLLLALCGGWMMTRKGWNAPGWASMLCSYVAFAGWQWLGAAGGGSGELLLWFLPLLWCVFALPGVLGLFPAMDTPRERAWFSGLNNGLFFALFSLVWFRFEPRENYWIVCALAGVVFAACGYFARRARDGTSEPFIAQGLSCITASLVLKLGGWHLGLALSAESLALAWMFRRWHTRMEWLLAHAAGLLVLGWAFAVAAGATNAPPWSCAISALLLAGAASGMRRAEDDAAEETKLISAAGAAAFLAMAVAVGMVGWLLRLPVEYRLASAAGVSTVVTAASFFLDRKRWWPQTNYAGMPFLGACFIMIFEGSTQPASYLITTLLAITGTLLWNRAMRQKFKERGRPAHLSRNVGGTPTLLDLDRKTGPEQLHPMIEGANALLAGMAAHEFIRLGNFPLAPDAIWMGAAGLGFVALGLVFRCGMFLSVGPALVIAGLAARMLNVLLGNPGAGILFALAGMAALALAAHGFFRSRTETGPWLAGLVLSRFALLATWCAAWFVHRPEDWGDWLGLSGVVVLIVFRALGRKLPVDFFVLVAAVVIWRLAAWSDKSPPIPEFAGWGVTALFVVWLFGSKKSGDTPNDGLGFAISAMTTAVTTAWVTELVIHSHGWKPVALVWTGLGFVQVAAGLWRQMRWVRIFGFLLLGGALAKLLVSDVWDFTTVWRISTFIVLGVALLLLGLFYHRIVPGMKTMIGIDENKNAPAD
ncbi:MAG: DUF2339 domain-containing protein [Verrucomicrobiota bacterium]